MVSKHSLNIFASRFSLVYKTLLYISVVTLLVVAIAVSAILPSVSPLISEVREIGFIPHIGEAFSALFSGDTNLQNVAFMQLKTDYFAVLETFSNNMNLVWLGAGLILIFFFIYKFLTNLSHLPISDVTNYFMTSNMKYGFTSNFILNIRQSLAYSLLHTLVLLPITALMIGVVVLIAFVVSKISYILMAMAIYISLILLFALKRAMFAYWIPIIVVEKKPAHKAFVENFKLCKNSFCYNFGYYFIMYFLIAAITLLFTLATFGTGFIIALTMITVFFKSSDMVIYYRKKSLKYYIDHDTVVNSKSAINDDTKE